MASARHILLRAFLSPPPPCATFRHNCVPLHTRRAVCRRFGGRAVVLSSATLPTRAKSPQAVFSEPFEATVGSLVSCMHSFATTAPVRSHCLCSYRRPNPSPICNYLSLKRFSCRPGTPFRIAASLGGHTPCAAVTAVVSLILPPLHTRPVFSARPHRSPPFRPAEAAAEVVSPLRTSHPVRTPPSVQSPAPNAIMAIRSWRRGVQYVGRRV